MEDTQIPILYGRHTNSMSFSDIYQVKHALKKLLFTDSVQVRHYLQSLFCDMYYIQRHNHVVFSAFCICHIPVMYDDSLCLYPIIICFTHLASASCFL